MTSLGVQPPCDGARAASASGVANGSTGIGASKEASEVAVGAWVSGTEPHAATASAAPSCPIASRKLWLDGEKESIGFEMTYGRHFRHGASSGG